MRFAFKVAAACAVIAAAQASAQVVGGSGGVGGSLGGALGGTAGGLGGTVGGTLGTNTNTGVGAGGIGVGANTGVNGALGTGFDVNSGRFDASSAVALDARTAASVDSGAVVRDTSGRVVGRVRAIQRTATGAVQSVAVQVGDRVATLPAANFGVTAEALVSAMSRADVRREARRQDGGQSASRSGEGDRSRSSHRDGGTVREQ